MSRTMEDVWADMYEGGGPIKTFIQKSALFLSITFITFAFFQCSAPKPPKYGRAPHFLME